MGSKELYGVGGWLLFFIITLFISALINVSDSVLVFLLLITSALLLILIKNKFAVIFTICVLSFCLIIGVFYYFVISYYPELGIEGGVNIIYPIIWIIYLSKSKRVKNTYFNKNLKKRADRIVEFPIKGWKWIFYVIGWILGIANPLFWAYQYILYMMYDYGEKFISDKFHKRVYYWGWFMLAVIVISISYLFFGIYFNS